MRACAGIPPDLDMTWLLYIILGVAAGLKVILYLYCVALQKQSESMLALAEDHRNDILAGGVVDRSSWWHSHFIVHYLLLGCHLQRAGELHCCCTPESASTSCQSMSLTICMACHSVQKRICLKNILYTATVSNAPMVPYLRMEHALITLSCEQQSFL